MDQDNDEIEFVP